MHKQLNKIQIITRNIASLSFSQFATLGITFFTSIILIRFLGAQHYGQYSLVLTIIGIFGFAIDLGLSQLVIREVSKRKEESSEYLTNFLLVQAAVSSVFFILAVIFVNAFHYEPIIRMGVTIVGAGMIVGAFVRPLSAILNAHEEMHRIALANFVVAVLNMVAIFLLVRSSAKLTFFFWLTMATNGLTLILMAYAGKKFFTLQKKINPTLIKRLLIMTIPFALLMIFNIIYGKVDVFLISRIMHSDSAVGLYSAAYRVIDALIIVPSTISSVLFPIIARNIGDKSLTDFVASRVIKFTAGVGIPIAVGTSVFGTRIITLLFGDSFSESGSALKILIWMIAVISSYAIMGNILLSANRVKLLVKLNVIGIIINIGLNLLLIRKYGIIGAAISSVGSEILVMALHAYFASAYIKYSQLKNDFLKIFISCGVMLGAAYLMHPMHILISIPALIIIYAAMMYIVKFIQPNELTLIKQILPQRNQQAV